MRHLYTILLRSMRGCKNNMKMDLKDLKRKGADWIQLVRDRVQCQSLVNTILNHRVP
jgi:hypothetical protein